MNYIKHITPYKTISEAILSDNGVELYSTQPYNQKQQYNISQYWNENNFNKINLPIIIGNLTQKEIELYTIKEDIRVLDTPVKFPHTDYKLPKELAHLQTIIQKIIDYENSINNDIDNYYCYLTIDRRLVTKNSHTRKEGIHVDGFQGSRLEQLYKADHSYIIHSNTPTLFYNQSFKVHNNWDKSCHNYFKGFEEQKIIANQLSFENHTILFIDAYTLHEAAIATEDIYRTFLRLSFTQREFDRLGNAHNPMFNYQWNMIPRDIQCELITPPFKK